MIGVEEDGLRMRGETVRVGEKVQKDANHRVNLTRCSNMVI